MMVFSVIVRFLKIFTEIRSEFERNSLELRCSEGINDLPGFAVLGDHFATTFDMIGSSYCPQQCCCGICTLYVHLYIYALIFFFGGLLFFFKQ